MKDCKSAKVPMDSGIELVKDVYQGKAYQATKEQIQGYQSLVGSLLWLACMTRPDISFSVGKCSRYASNPTPTHDAALKRIVRYLKGSKRLGLKYGLGPDPQNSNGNLLVKRGSSGCVRAMVRSCAQPKQEEKSEGRQNRRGKQYVIAR